MDRAIGAISRLSEQNHRIVFDDCGEGSYMKNNETGEIYELRKKDSGDYVIDVVVAPYDEPF